MRGAHGSPPPPVSVVLVFVPCGAHPCLLSSSGSCPGELERRAQLLSAGEDFILRGGKTQTQISGAKNCVALQPPRRQNISVFAQKQRPNRTQVVFPTKALFDLNIGVVFSSFLNQRVTWPLQKPKNPREPLTPSPRAASDPAAPDPETAAPQSTKLPSAHGCRIP